jgi:hypothetical protein
MGYETKFTLTLDIPKDSLTTIETFSEYLEGFAWDDYEHHYLSNLERSNNLADEKFYVSGTWYDHDKDMLKLSKEFPDILFTLDGNGEEWDDIWRAYYKNGRTYSDHALISFPDYDESYLG